jgi:hypothetical protein
MKKSIFSILFLFSVVLLSANELAINNKNNVSETSEIITSNKISGVIVDKTSNERLAGVAIVVNGQKIYTDLNGRFEINSTKGSKLHLKVSMISYNDKVLEFDSSDETLKIEMNQL